MFLTSMASVSQRVLFSDWEKQAFFIPSQKQAVSARAVGVVLPSVALSLDRAQPCTFPLLSMGLQGKQTCFCGQIKMVPLLAAAKTDLCTILLE